MSPAVERGGRPRAVAVAALVLGSLALLAFVQRAEAAELAYWDNYKSGTISVANLDGSGGSELNLAGATLAAPEGMAIDTATGRLFVASSSGGPEGRGAILAVALDGSGATVFASPGAPVDLPYGVVIDPRARTVYWANNAVEGSGSIAWASLDGSAGGTLNTAGATVDEPFRVGLDPVNGRVYWVNVGDPAGLTISYAKTDNSGGGDLKFEGSLGNVFAFAVDPAAGRLYWSEGTADRFAYSGLLGGPIAFLDTGGADVDSPYGFAIDPTADRVYWANYGNRADPAGALGFAKLSGGGGGNITPEHAPVDGPEDMVVLKSPTGTGPPILARSPTKRTALSCSTGTWADDFGGSFVYQAPTSYAYQWLRNGIAVGGATAATFTAAAPGSYVCTVTAVNQAGSTAQKSAPINLRRAKIKLSTSKKARAKPGGRVTFRVKAVNRGDLRPKRARLCVKLPKASRDDLRAPRCRKLRLEGGKKKTLRLKVRVKRGADKGTAKLTFRIRGGAGRAAKSKVVVK